MKKSTLLVAALAMSASAFAQETSTAQVFDTNIWYQLESCITTVGNARVGAVVGLTNETTNSLAINGSTPSGSDMLWAMTKAEANTAAYDYQLWRFAEDPENAGQYALICKAQEGCVNPTPTVENGNAARWQYTSTLTYGFIPMSGQQVKTTANDNTAIVLTTTQQAAVNANRHMNFAAGGQQWSINTNTMENDWQSNYIALVPVATVDGSAMPLNPALIAAKKSAVESYFNSSYSGAEYAPYFIDALDECTTEEELDETYADLVNTAMLYAQSDMETGFVWKNNRAGNYATYSEEGINNGTDEDPIISYFNLDSDITLNAYYKAEFTDNGNTPMPASDRKFRLLNIVSGKYFGIIDAWPNVAPLADYDDAALISLVAGDNGFEFIITNSQNDKAYINASSNAADPKLTIYPYDNDGGNFWTAAALPTFDAETQPMEVTFVGETTPTDWGGLEYSSIQGIQIKVPVGAAPSGLGTITAYINGDEPTVIYKAEIAAALEGVTPTEGNIKMISYDENWETVYTTVPADVYSIVLNPERTEAAEYIVEINPAAFTLESDGTTLYSPEARNYAAIEEDETFTITVTPEAGELKELTVITLDSWEGMAPNYGKAEAENITLVCGEATLLDLDSSEIQEYDSYDFDDASKPFYTIPVTGATKSGEYTLTIPAGFFENDNMVQNELTTVTWNLKVNETGIATITDVTVTVYDLQGRKLNRPANGVNIINGRKVLVK